MLQATERTLAMLLHILSGEPALQMHRCIPPGTESYLALEKRRALNRKHEILHCHCQADALANATSTQDLTVQDALSCLAHRLKSASIFQQFHNMVLAGLEV